MSRPKRIIEFKDVKPNWAISNQYRVQLNKLTKAMIKDVVSATMHDYRQDASQIKAILQDANPVNMLYKNITIRLTKWQKLYNDIASKLSINFVNNVDYDVQKQLQRNLSPAKEFLVVEFNQGSKKALIAKEAQIKENVNLITNIPDEMRKQIHQEVMMATSRGRDIGYLQTKLRNIGSKTENMVKLISRDQINKATSVVNAARQAELGITKNKWKYTYISKEPRLSHLHANGEIYKIDKGCKIDGEYIYPGEKINCNCTSAPVIEFD